MSRLDRLDQLEIRLAAPDEKGVFSGYAAVWCKVDSYGDIVEPGAFAASLATHRAAGTTPLLLRGHDPDRPIGSWDNIQEDATGLKVEGRLILDSTDGRDAFALMRGGALNGLSIGFRTVKAEPLPGGGRRMRAMNLIEVSAVTRPAQAAARVTAVRSVNDGAALAAFIRQQTEKLKGVKNAR